MAITYVLDGILIVRANRFEQQGATLASVTNKISALDCIISHEVLNNCWSAKGVLMTSLYLRVYATVLLERGG